MDLFCDFPKAVFVLCTGIKILNRCNDITAILRRDVVFSILVGGYSGALWQKFTKTMGLGPDTDEKNLLQHSPCHN